MLVGVVLCLSSCRVDMAVRVESDEFGAGRVSVTAELDRDAAAAVLPARTANPLSTDPAATVGRIQFDDFRAAGWEGPGAVRNADGSARFALHHRFTTVRQANELLAQLSGPKGPLAGLRLQRTRSPVSTQVRLSGPGDFRDGLVAFGDEKLGVVTGNGSFGLSDAEVLRQANGESLDDVFGLRIDADLIGSKRSWKLPVGTSSPILFRASSTSWATLAGGGGALGALVALVGMQVKSKRRIPVAAAGEETP